MSTLFITDNYGTVFFPGSSTDQISQSSSTDQLPQSSSTDQISQSSSTDQYKSTEQLPQSSSTDQHNSSSANVICQPPTTANNDCLDQIPKFKSNSELSKPLTIRDLPCIFDTIISVAPDCHNLGLQLGLQYHQIRTIEKNKGDCKDQLREIIATRLNQEVPLTWREIITALRANSVGEDSQRY